MLMIALSKKRFSYGFQWMAGVAALLPAVMMAQASSPVGGLPEDLLPELRPILRNAILRSPQMLTNDIYVAQAEANRYSTDAGLWPSIYANAGYNQYSSATDLGGTRSVSDTAGLSYSVGGSQPLFHWGALKYRSEVGRISVRIAERQYAEAYRLLAGTIRSQYLALIGKKASLRYARYALDRAEKNLLVEEAKFKEGTISPGELIVPRMSLADARLTADKAVADYESSKRMLARLAGMTEIAEETIPLEVGKPTHLANSANELLRVFQKEGPGVTNQGMVYLMTLRQSDLNYRIAKTGLYPKFSFSMNYGLSFQDQVVPATGTTGSFVLQSEISSFSYGVNASWTIFDGFATRGAKLAALASKRSTERLLQSYADTTNDSVDSMHKQLEFAMRSLELSEQRYGLAKASVDRTNEDFRLGLTSQSAVDSASSSLLYANITLISARSDYLLRWAEFVSQVGADPVMANLPARYVRPLK
jgi:outer membrane protein TolC